MNTGARTGVAALTAQLQAQQQRIAAAAQPVQQQQQHHERQVAQSVPNASTLMPSSLSAPPTPPISVPPMDDSDDESNLTPVPQQTLRQTSQENTPNDSEADDDDEDDDEEVSSDSADENEREDDGGAMRRKLSERKKGKAPDEDDDDDDDGDDENEEARRAAVASAAAAEANENSMSITITTASHPNDAHSHDGHSHHPSLSTASSQQPGAASHRNSDAGAISHRSSASETDVEPGTQDIHDAPINQQENGFTSEEDAWEEYFDPNTNHPYYYNPYTNETVWVKPLTRAEKLAEEKAQQDAALALAQAQAQKDAQTQAARALIAAQQQQSQVLAQSITQPQIFVAQQQALTASGKLDLDEQPMDLFQENKYNTSSTSGFPSYDGVEDEDGDVLEEIASTRPGWSCIRIMSRWQTHSSSSTSTAGGCYPNFATWRQNPQFQICPTGNNPVKVLIELKFEVEKKATDKKSPAAGFYIFVNSGPSMQKLHVKKEDVIIRSDFLKSGNVIAEVTLPPPQGYTLWQHHQRGNHHDYAYLANTNNPFPMHYTIVPSTFEPERSGNFCMSIHSSERILVQKLPSYQRWQQVTIAGEWNGATAGGCRNHKSWGANPQYILFPTGDQPARLLVVLSQVASANMVAIGLYSFNKNNANAGKASFMLAPEVYAEILADPKESPYMLVPCTFDPGLEANFQLSVYAPTAISLYKNN